jgi:hypothetical protein
MGGMVKTMKTQIDHLIVFAQTLEIRRAMVRIHFGRHPLVPAGNILSTAPTIASSKSQRRLNPLA